MGAWELGSRLGRGTWSLELAKLCFLAECHNETLWGGAQAAGRRVVMTGPWAEKGQMLHPVVWLTPSLLGL